MIAADISRHLERVRTQIAAAAARSGRSGQVTLVAVTKTVPAERVQAAFAAGQRTFGENRVHEGVAKITDLADATPGAEWHLIGHLQSNKARQAVEAFSLIESIDSLKLAIRVDRLAAELSRRLPVLLEINVSGEASKSGFEPAGFWSALPELLALDHVELRGLMTIAPLSREPEDVRGVFRELRELRDRAQDRYALAAFGDLSMGMSNDFQVAIEEGSTMVRIGRAIFGERPRNAWKAAN